MINELVDKLSIKKSNGYKKDAVFNSIMNTTKKDSVVGARGPRLANIGIPMGVARKGNEDLTRGNEVIMPDGALYNEVNTYDIPTKNYINDTRKAVLDRMDELYEKDGLMSKGQKKVLYKNFHRLENTQIKQVDVVNEKKPKTVGNYSPRTNKMRIKRGAHIDMKRGIIDHEVGHTVQVEPFKKMYKTTRGGKYEDRMPERVSYTFGSRQIPKMYSDTNSSNFIHPSAVYDPIDEVFVDGSSAYSRSADKAGVKYPGRSSKKYSSKLAAHVDSLNKKLDNNDTFRQDMQEMFNTTNKVQSRNALKKNLSWYEW